MKKYSWIIIVLVGVIVLARYFVGSESEALIKGPSAEALQAGEENKKFEKHYDNGQLKETGFKNEEAQKVGEWTTYFANGQQQAVTPYEKGKVHGKLRHYDGEGQLRGIESWKDGKPHGEWIMYDKTGEVKSREFYKEGKKQAAENQINPTPAVKSIDTTLDIESGSQATDVKQERTADFDVSKPVYESIKEENPFPLTHQEELLQSDARPLDMDIVAEVQASKEDPGYAKFVDEVLPKLNPKLKKHFDKRKEIVDNSLEAELDDLRLDQDSNVRVYFIKEGTVFQNSLGIGLEDEDKLIFPNASSAVSYFRDSTTRVEQTNEDSPMLPGDYVDLGLMKKGSLLDLFIIKDGARDENGAIYGIDKENNPDKSNHVRIHEVVNENTLIVGFEDLPGGGDKDYNDLVIAVEIIPVEAKQ